MPGHARKLITAAIVAATGSALAVGLSVSAAASAPNAAVTAADDFCLGQCADVVPPGENGNATLTDILAHKALGTRPKHADDQIGKYDALATGYQTLTTDTITKFFNDSSFGVPADQVERTDHPRSDVTIVRDKATGVPHVYGTTRSGTEFGAGYAAAQDRLFLMDVLRRVGRGQLTPLAGGAAANQELEQGFFAGAPYTEDELQNQINEAAAAGPRGAQAMQDAQDYINGINQYITESYNGRYFPGEYDLLGIIDPITNAGHIDPFKLTDLAVIASVVGSQFGGGGGGEVQAAIAKLAILEKYGPVQGEAVWKSMRGEDDPEATYTLHDGQSFPYGKTPANPQGQAMPDPGSVTPQQLVFDRTGSAVDSATAAKQASAAQRKTGDTTAATTKKGASKTDTTIAKGMFNDGVLPGNMLKDKHGMSNALLVSGAHTASGHPVAVFGPQTGYFAPQLLMLEELQGPGISARGASFAGISFYVLLGRGQDYSWSATSASQDITDTYAVDLCNPDGSPATKDSNSYVSNGQCTPMQTVERKDAWKSSLGSTVPAGSYTLRSYRTKYGPVVSRATIGGKPVAYAQLRSTFGHELDTVIGFQEFNDPDAIHSAADFQRAASHVTYTFNWFYADSRDIAYFNSGANPVRNPNVDPSMPIKGDAGFDWQGWDPATNKADYTPYEQHPNSTNQDYYTNWNNQQAHDFAAGGYERQAVHRGDLLDTRVKNMIASGTKVTRVNLVQAMEDAGLTDLRAERVLPYLLRVLGDGDADTSGAIASLKAWLQHGGKRAVTAAGSKTYADADAVALMDAWWPLLVKAEFQPGLGDNAYNAMTGVLRIDETPGTQSGHPHQGSAFQSGWYGYVSKDLRTVLGDPVQGPLGAKFCGGGDLAQCKQILLGTLKQAAAQPRTTTYPGDGDCDAGDQWCADTIVHTALGGITQDKIGWQNRPTFQQVVEYPAKRGDSITNLAANRSVTATSAQRFLPSAPASNAVDTNPSSRWASDWSDHQSITVDLGSVQPVARVRLYWESAYGRAYTIDVSADGTAWQTVYRESAGNGGVDNVAFAPANARYVRMTGVQRGTNYGYSLYEFEVFGH
ncbi:penicillin acylase family protein [Labedaea rhizosphaerae]|uniref:Acyl-homoserine lactone acylase PvdQ n=1 Tax=Labedaea rhizosphaerae TaxID=598644 RepID=A0A4R6SJX0_LABRH|nr:penicillin acylase family protein [Labedaea rhizosphaerae]TDQ04359.1 acyl-homoserine lactone acylase PvdQ [Labedaea rhizosphaerae]